MNKNWFAYIYCAVLLVLSLVGLGFKQYLLGGIIGVAGVVFGLLLIKSPDLFKNWSNSYNDDSMEELLIRGCGGVTVLLCGVTAVTSVVLYGVTSVANVLGSIL